MSDEPFIYSAFCVVISNVKCAFFAPLFTFKCHFLYISRLAYSIIYGLSGDLYISIRALYL